MSNLLKSKFFLGVMIVAVMVAGLAMFAVVNVNTASADCTITSTLRIGSSGAEVACLQAIVGATADGAFGPLTQAAVIAWQAGHNLAADGVVGPLTRAAIVASGSISGNFPAGCSSASGYSVTTGLACNSLPANTFAPAGCTSASGFSPVTGGACYAVSSTLPAGCTSTAGFSPTTGASCSGGTTPTGPLTGGAGSANYTLMSDWSSEIVGEDESDVEVAGLKVEANGSDLDLTAVRIVFVAGAAATSDFEDYADEVSIWLDGEEIGRVDGSEFTDDNTYTSTITLDGGVVQEDETGELVVAITGVGNLDTGDAGDTWTVDFRSVRFVDALGDSTAEDPSTATKTFSFESFATSSESELKLELTDDAAGDAINKAHLINVHATDENQSKGVVLLDFTMEAEGGSDLDIRDFGIDLITTNANVDGVIAGGTAPEVFLEIEGVRYGTAGYNEDADDTTVGADEEVAFTDVDYTIDAGDTVHAQIVANILAVDTALAEGDTLLAQITETQTDDTALMDVRDESGTQVVDADITGEPTGVASTMRDWGFDLTFVSGTASRSHTGDVANTLDHDEGTFVLVFEVSSWDDNADTATAAIYIDEDAPDESGGATESDITVTGTDTYVTSSLTRTGGDSSTHSADTFRVDAGDTVEFTITFVTAAGADGLFDITLESLLYALTDVDGDLTVADAQIELTDDFITKPPLSLNFDA